MEITLTTENFEEVVLKSEKPVLIDFWATWCGPCKMISPFVERIAGEREDIKVCKVNVDEEEALAVKFKIMSIPTIVIIKDGEIAGQVIGYRSYEELTEFIDKSI